MILIAGKSFWFWIWTVHSKCKPIIDIDDPANLGHPHPSHFSHEACGPSLKIASSSFGLTQKTTRFTSITLPPPDPNGGPPPKKLKTLLKRKGETRIKDEDAKVKYGKLKFAVIPISLKGLDFTKIKWYFLLRELRFKSSSNLYNIHISVIFWSILVHFDLPQFSLVHLLKNEKRHIWIESTYSKPEFIKKYRS